jgi:hypothetical protein
MGALVVWFWSNPEDPWGCCAKGRTCAVCCALLASSFRRFVEEKRR